MIACLEIAPRAALGTAVRPHLFLGMTGLGSVAHGPGTEAAGRAALVASALKGYAVNGAQRSPHGSQPSQMTDAFDECLAHGDKQPSNQPRMAGLPEAAGAADVILAKVPDTVRLPGGPGDFLKAPWLSHSIIAAALPSNQPPEAAPGTCLLVHVCNPS